MMWLTQRSPNKKMEWVTIGKHKHKVDALSQCYAGNDSKDGYNYRVVEKERQ